MRLLDLRRCGPHPHNPVCVNKVEVATLRRCQFGNSPIRDPELDTPVNHLTHRERESESLGSSRRFRPDPEGDGFRTESHPREPALATVYNTYGYGDARRRHPPGSSLKLSASRRGANKNGSPNVSVLEPLSVFGVSERPSNPFS